MVEGGGDRDMSKLIKRIYDFFIKIKGRICVSKNRKKKAEEKEQTKNAVETDEKDAFEEWEQLKYNIHYYLESKFEQQYYVVGRTPRYCEDFRKKLYEISMSLAAVSIKNNMDYSCKCIYLVEDFFTKYSFQDDKVKSNVCRLVHSLAIKLKNASNELSEKNEDFFSQYEKHKNIISVAFGMRECFQNLNYKLQLWEHMSLANKSKKKSCMYFWLSLLAFSLSFGWFAITVFPIIDFLKFPTNEVSNEWLKYIIWITIKTPSIILAWMGIKFLNTFSYYDKEQRELLMLDMYKQRLSGPVTQDALMVALAPNYFGTKRNRRSDNNFMEKLLLKMIPTLNINAGGGSNNGNNGGQNGGQNT